MTPGCDLRTRGTNSTNKGRHSAACRERVRDSGVCSSRWSAERDTYSNRHRDNRDALDEPVTKARTNELPSSSKRGNPEEFDDESQQRRRRLRFTCPRAHATRLRAHVCACLPVCVLVRCGTQFLRARRTRTVQLARPHAAPPTLSLPTFRADVLRAA